MANRETSDEMSSLAARVLAEKKREGDEHLSFNALLVQAKRLAGCVLAQVETPGKRAIGKHPALAAPYTGHPSIRLRDITDNMRSKIVDFADDDANKITEPVGFLLEAFEQYADQIDAVRADIVAPAAGTSAYEMVAAVETQNVEVTESLIHMVAGTVLAKLIDEEGGGRANVSFSPADMDAMNQRYMLHATRDGMLTTVKIEPRPGVFAGEGRQVKTVTTEDGYTVTREADLDPPESFYRQDGIDSTEPAHPQAPEHVFDRPLWAARVDGKLFPTSDQAQAMAIVGRADVGQIAQVENRFCYHPECPAEHCNRAVNQSALVSDQDSATLADREVTSDVDSPDA